MSACWNLFWPFSDMGKRILEAMVLVLVAVVAAVVMLKVPPQTPPGSSFPTGMHQFGGAVFNVMALLYFASICAIGEWDCNGRTLILLLLAMTANTWAIVYALPIVLSRFVGDDLWSFAGGFLFMQIAVCVLPAVVYVPFYTRGVNAAEKRKQAEHEASSTQ